MAAYCAPCYRRYEEDPFPIQTTLEEEEGESGFETEESHEERFQSAREGDHVMSLPFECDMCQFRNVAQRDVDWCNAKDIYTLICIRGASLDACGAEARAR